MQQHLIKEYTSNNENYFLKWVTRNPRSTVSSSAISRDYSFAAFFLAGVDKLEISKIVIDKVL